MKTAPALLVELVTEELPPGSLVALSEAFAQGIAARLGALQLLSDGAVVTTYATPRRLAVHISAVKDRSDDQPFQQKLMPLAVAQDKARQWTTAFVKKLDALGRSALANVPVGTQVGADVLKVESDGKTEAVYLQGVASGHVLIRALQTVLDETLAALPIAKGMNYQLADGRTTVQFVRPARRLVALHGHAVVPISALGLIAGTKSAGHRFHSEGDLVIHSPDTYARQLFEEGKVIASFAQRRARIATLLEHAAALRQAEVVMPASLLDEVTALVEWPVVIESGFDAAFLDLPPQCLVLTMQQNQKYFALRDAKGALMNRFLLVSNIEAKAPQTIVAGNARVVRARLADAKFFFDQDRLQPLASRLPGLAAVVYHQKLGSQLDRVNRITTIAVSIATMLGADVTQAKRAAQLCKADLRTLMVGEFPELQGIMGRAYALHDGEPAAVAVAIETHYWPKFAGDNLPSAGTGACVALADKLETLVGLFGINERPTGDKDPYALRRHALGLLRILLEQRLALQLPSLVAQACGAFAGCAGWLPPNEALLSFLYDRLHGLMRERGYSTHEVDAVVQARPARIDHVPAVLDAVRAFALLPEASSLSAANKRIGNILKKSDGELPALNAALLIEPAEKALAAAFEQVAPRAENYLAQGDYKAMLKALAPLKAPVDQFFDDVMVNVDDLALRGNRLALLAALRAQMNRVADLSRLAV